MARITARRMVFGLALDQGFVRCVAGVGRESVGSLMGLENELCRLKAGAMLGRAW